MTRDTPPNRCLVCNRTPRRSFRLSNGAVLLRCPQCGMGWWAWPPLDPARFYDRWYFQSPDSVATDVSSAVRSGRSPCRPSVATDVSSAEHVERGYDDYAALEAGLQRTARRRLRTIDRLARRLPAGAARRLLDIGCGTGTFLVEARRVGWEVRGVEVSGYVAQAARDRGLAVSCEAIEQTRLEPASYECVTLWDVLEHLRDPLGVLQSAGLALRPGGVLALSTGDITSLCARLSGRRWHLLTLPEHLFFFSPASLRQMLRAAGCRVVWLTREVNWVPVAYVLERLAKSLWSRGRGPARMLGAGCILPATLFDVLGVYAVRTASRLPVDACTRD